MMQESLFHVYQANRHVGAIKPIIIVTGDTTWKGFPFSEHFIISSLPGQPVIFQPTYLSIQSNSGETFDDFPEVFSAPALLKSELQRARDHFESLILSSSRDLHGEIYWSHYPLDFQETSEGFLTQLVLLGRHAQELQRIFQSTRNTKLKSHAQVLACLPRIVESDQPPRV